MSQIEIVRPGAGDIAACLSLLPEASVLRPTMLAARIEGKVVGAAGLSWREWSSPPGFPLMIAVDPSARRRGIGRALIDAAALLAADDAEGMWASDPHPIDGDVAAFLEACAFRVMRRQFDFELPFAAVAALTAPSMERLRSEGRTPSGAEVVPLTDAMLPAVARVVGASFDKPAESMLAVWRGSRDVVDLSWSRALMMNGQIVGALLVTHLTGVPLIEAVAVLPEHRGGGAAAMLFADAVSRGNRNGAVDVIQYRCEEDARIPMALAQASGGRVVETRGWFYRLIG